MEPILDNRRLLESYSQNDVTVLREACKVFRPEFIQIGNLEVFLESHNYRVGMQQGSA